MKSKPVNKRHWSDDLEAMKETASRDHYIEVETRRVAIESLTPDLQKAGSVFLDAGCSTGWLLDDVGRAFPNARAVGADPFRSGLRKARARMPGIRVVQFDLCRAPFKDKSFDAIASLNVLEHIEEDILAFREIRRMLRPDGSAFLMVPAGRHLYNYFDEVDHHVRRYEKNEFRDKILAAGFSIRKLNFMGIFLYPAFYIVKKYGRWKMKNASIGEKRLQVMNDIKPTAGSSFLGAATLELERRWGSCLPHLFGMRLYAHVGRGGT